MIEFKCLLYFVVSGTKMLLDICFIKKSKISNIIFIYQPKEATIIKIIFCLGELGLGIYFVKVAVNQTIAIINFERRKNNQQIKS